MISGRRVIYCDHYNTKLRERGLGDMHKGVVKRKERRLRARDTHEIRKTTKRTMRKEDEAGVCGEEDRAEGRMDGRTTNGRMNRWKMVTFIRLDYFLVAHDYDLPKWWDLNSFSVYIL